MPRDVISRQEGNSLTSLGVDPYSRWLLMRDKRAVSTSWLIESGAPLEVRMNVDARTSGSR